MRHLVTKRLFLAPLICCGLAAQTPPVSAVFDTDTVHEIRLTFARADWWEKLTTDYEQNADDVPYTEAAMVWGSYKYDVIGVRFKGNSSYNGATTKKKPFRFKLNEFVKGQKIDGMASFSLSNAWNDPSFVREKTYYEMAAAMGLKAPRSSFAALYINDQYWGLYVLTECVNGDFLKNYFGKDDDDGNLYKADDMGSSFEYLGTDPAAYKQFFSKESNEDAGDWTDLIEFCQILNDTPVENLKATLDPLVDIDSVLMALALDNLTVNLDSYVSMGQNFYVYKRPSDGKWVWIHWDPSLAFGALAQGLSETEMERLSLEWTGAGTSGVTGAQFARPLATKLWAVPAYLARYRELYKQLVEKTFTPATLVARMTALRSMIRPYVAADTQKLVTMDQFEQAMTSTGGSTTPGGTAPGGTTPPAGDGTTPPADPGTTPPTGGGTAPPTGGGTTPPTGGGGVPGGGAGGAGGMSGAPGLQPFLEARAAWVKMALAGQTVGTLSASSSSLLFAQVAGGEAPRAKTVDLTLSDASKTAAYTASSTAKWLTIPATGTAPGSLTVSVDGAKLSAGSYSDTIAVTIPGASNSPISIAVTLVVTATPAFVVSPAALAFTAGGMTGGTPGEMPGGTQGPAGGQPTTTTSLSQTVRVTSSGGEHAVFTLTAATANCGSFLKASPVTSATPETITVTVDATKATEASCTGTITVSGAEKASATIAVTMSSTTMAAPTIASVLNAASYGSGAIAPGEIVTIFGSNLGPRMLVNGELANGQLSTTVGGVQVTFNGQTAPILYARNDQIGAVVPFEVADAPQAAVKVTMGGSSSTALNLTVVAAAPGLFTVNSTGSGQASILNQTGAANGPQAPAAKGSTVAIYLTGGGALSPAGPTGSVGSSQTLQRIVAPVSVTIGGQSATVTYAGATPTAILGLYQVNAVAPATVASGAVPVVVTIGGVSSQATATLTVQ